MGWHVGGRTPPDSPARHRSKLNRPVTGAPGLSIGGAADCFQNLQKCCGAALPLYELIPNPLLGHTPCGRGRVDQIEMIQIGELEVVDRGT
ncbi:Uncharacterised protein [Mycobacteroides abscessus subsp. abscessus]|nr:Uncharacterised protein [Mycobacteroides abscessus subsp. abscessus]